ncbi:uncharacterized protein [Neodiprion pinetum]|uniref:uncharacterized protein n=1 Tax=Neodiprion pinetum TaxID=441929 RepID=UPI001EE0AC39|nr:uncharacterized protein LOC124217409 [Neodiprion pinetum]
MNELKELKIDNMMSDEEVEVIESTDNKKLELDNFNDNGKRALIIMPEDAQISEIVQMADIMRRAGISVVIASLDDSDCIRGNSNIFCYADAALSDALREPSFDVVVLPGGLLGAKSLGESELVGKLLKEFEDSHKWIVAIGDAVPVLRKHYIGAGRTFTCHPLIKYKIEGSEYMKYKYIDDDVHVDGKIITCRGGPNTIQCALNLVHLVCGRYIAENIAEKLSIKYDDGYCRECCGNCKYCCREDKKEIDPNIAERFSCSTCCGVSYSEIVEWEECRVLSSMLEKEYMIKYKIQRQELKDREEDRSIEEKELQQQIKEDEEELKKRREKWTNMPCMTQAEYDRYMREYAEREESRYNDRMQKIYDRLHMRLKKSRRHQDMIDSMRNMEPNEMDAALAQIT